MSDNKTIIYREPVPEDAEKIVDFYNFVGGETTYLSFEKDEYPMDAAGQREDILSTNAHPASIMILAMDGDEIAGIGSEIIRRLIDFCKGNGITTRIQLDTRCDNEVAVKLYERFGFEIEGRLKNTTLLNGNYYDMYVMGLML